MFLDKTLSRMLSLSASLIGCVLQIKSVETSIDGLKMQDTVGCMPAAQKPQLFVGAGWVSYESRAELQHSL